jgi:acyl-CoA synthetase (AMP-forming)/AMP-acid ligase II
VSERLSGRELWRRRVEQTPDRPFLLFEARSWSFADFDVETRRLAAGLRRIGVERETRVLVGMANRPETVMLQLALQELGAVLVPLLPGMTFGEYEFLVNHCEAGFLVAEEPIASAILGGHEALPQLNRFVLLGDVEPPAGVAAERLEELFASEPLPHEELEGYDDRSLALILYTSGSTGRPKGVMIGAGSMPSVGEAFSERFGITAEDNYFVPLPLAHAVGSVTAIGISLHNGCPLTLADRFSPSTFWRHVTENGATTAVLFPTHLNLLLETDDGTPAAGESSFRLAITHSYVRRFRERFGVEIATVWGMTETTICAGSEAGYLGEHGENYVGTPMRGTEVGILDENMRELPPGEPGEICLRHPHVMLGYLKDPEATARTLVDGWVRSGDRGVADEEGRVFFVGRFKNMIKRSGENVSAEEVELAIGDHPDVTECAVFGVPDPIRTEEVLAVVVRRAGAEVDPAEIRDAAAAHLVRWKLPRYVVVRDRPLPRLPNGKIDQLELRAAVDLEQAWDATEVKLGTT